MKGLTTQEVKTRIEQGKVNQQDLGPEKTTRQIVHENVFTYFNLIFLVITILILLSGHFTVSDFLFLPVMISNALVGIYQEMRSQKTLRKLTIVSVPAVAVLRDGKRQQIPVDQLVLDDLIYLQAGDQISVDAELIQGSLSTDESILTGESDEIAKNAGDNLFSGSYVVSGDGMAKVTKVGGNTYAAKLVQKARTTERDDQGAMVRAIDRIVKWIGIIIIPIGIVMVLQSLFVNHLTFSQAINGMVAAIIGMIPEGLYLLVTVALATSAVRLARCKVLLHNMHSIEQLSRVDTLCIDKTGTITEPEMQVKAMLPVKGQINDQLKQAIGDAVWQFGADNETMRALQAYFPKKQGPAAQRVIPFKSANKYSALVYQDDTVALGAPENLLQDQFANFQETVDQYSKKGYRVLVYGHYGAPIEGDQFAHAIEPLAFIVLHNPVRENAPATFKFFAQQDVHIKVISGDNPVTVAAVAQAAGIKGADHYIDARQIKDDDIATAVEQNTVFGRITPDQKRKLVQALQKQGHTVAMTGDGVNDILAMKTADCSVAMASGASAAMNAASIVLLKSDFSTMPQIVDEGRRTVNNIQRSASLFLIKNIFSFLLALLTICTSMSYPLRSSQVSLISAFMIGIPGYLLTFEPDHSRIKGHFIRTVLSNAFPAALVDVFAIGLLMMVGNIFHMSNDDVSTVSAFIMAFVGIVMLVYLSRPLTLMRGFTILVSAVGFITAVTLMGELFRFVRPSLLVSALGLVFLLAAEAVLIDVRWLFRYFAQSWQYWRSKSRHGKK
ncbi:MAG TPA: HAD-IC family P-type ATPase [Candidatus Limosilactobacillus merdigallinarum]|uniref:HAD-IC family P-type ATPase n=1 Tax=Candidatus Limosilactobacillus merdigallinarum TaxID=2838652 RepID=A0A9D1VHF7_9LACO|nr:HAD-IC family P-type ATPase [Candidatus Limosilactobacillus merdigallinarum]